MTDSEKFLATFREEAADLLTEMESALLELEAHPEDPDLVDRVFRAMHTIKGSGAMVGLTDISAFTHVMETSFDAVRNGALAVTPALVDLALRGKDLVRGMLAGTADPAACAALVADFQAIDGAAAAQAAVEAPASRFRIRFQPYLDLFRDGTNPAGLLGELRAMGEARITAVTDAVPALAELDPESCYLSWDIELHTTKTENDIRDVFIFVEDHCTLTITALDTIADTAPPPVAAVLPEPGAARPDVVQPAVAEQHAVRSAQASAADAEATSSIRVAAAKLDSLVDLVGELVIAQARLTQTAGRLGNPDLISISEEIERLAGELRDNALDLRMVPIGSTFGRFKRLVRDLASSLGKQIELVTEGADTELDKTVIERLSDPLVHIIRNSCDHGIEDPALRSAIGKAPQGTVRLAAYQSGPNVIIEISDDGGGLDPVAIRQKAIERGLLAADATPSDRDLYQLIFQPGFSTAKAVSSVSGRGVGMDVVKRAIDALRGSVEVESRRGEGSTIRFTLPLTLAIIEGLLVGVGDASYVLPMSVVEECVELTREDVRAAHGNKLASVRGELVPYLSLRDWYGVDSAPPDIEQIVITGIDGDRFGLVVDGVIGQHQTVIKTLGGIYGHQKGLSGATILGDGTVALIVDVPTLLSTARAEAARRTPRASA